MEHWQQVKELFVAAADLPPAERGRFLDQACAGDARLRQELERLLDADGKNGEAIISAIETEARSLFTMEGVLGSRIGAYRIVDEVGSGGMGAVYLAVRDDDQYQKRVAIKLIRRGMDTADMLARFLHERQILANLEHPLIARLLDGGTSQDGRPFLVMDYVEGQPLDVYCRDRDLDIHARCRLFLKVCEAVSYAHRSLVVHRDLKPGNILVTLDGSPKLLDFGVAKLLDADTGAGRTMAALRPMTPDYASPEQIRGDPITTATDVYSLGAILYELLSGVRAHRFPSYGLREVERVICETDPPRLSEAAPEAAPHRRQQLQGDLEAIVSKAMRKEPASRYTTVDQLSADVERYLNGWPVSARQGNVAYRARKFVRRNRMAIAAAALLACALIGGTTAATIQARRAAREQARAEIQRRLALESEARAQASRQEAERQAAEAQRQSALAEAQSRQADLERIAADTQRQIADRRFEQVRQLSGKFLLDFHDAIAKLPGATAARKMVVETGLKYYDTLVEEAHGNRDLIEEVARGYVRLGDAQGNPYYANLGDISGALASYRKAVALRQKISDPSPRFLMDGINANIRIAQVLTVQGDMAGADRTLRETLRMGQQGPATGEYVVRNALAHAYDAHADLLARMGDENQAIEQDLKLLDLATQLARENRNRVADRGLLSLAHSKLGDNYIRVARGREALQHLRAALAIDEQFAAEDPDSNPRRRKVYIDNVLLGYLFSTHSGKQLVEPDEARRVMTVATGLADRMLAADPNNNTALLDVMGAESVFGDWLHGRGETEAALIHMRKALDAAERHAAIGPPTFDKNDALVEAHHRLGMFLTAAGRPEEALDHFTRAGEYLDRMGKQSPGVPRLGTRKAEILSGKSRLYASQKNWKDAAASLTAAIAVFDDLRKHDPKNEAYLIEQPDLYERLADCRAATGESSDALQAIQTALARFDEIASSRPLLAEEEQKRTEAQSKLAAWAHSEPRP